MPDPRNALEQKRRRLPEHDFVQHPEYAAFTYCSYPDPGNAVNGMCSMSESWHVRDHEERAAEADAEGGFTPDVDFAVEQAAQPTHTFAHVFCQVHEVEHDTREMPVRTYTIQVVGPTRYRVKLLRELKLEICDMVATQLGLLPLP